MGSCLHATCDLYPGVKQLSTYVQDDSYLESYISTIGVDFVSDSGSPMFSAVSLFGSVLTQRSAVASNACCITFGSQS